MTRDEIERIRQEHRIEQIIGQYLALKPSGRCLMARCPFHEDRSPSLAVFPLTQTWWCFSCGIGGDVFTFLQRIERVTFPEAIQRLDGAIAFRSSKEKSKLPLHPLNPAPLHSLTSEHFTLLTAATEVYHAAMFTHPKLLTYLARRGFDAEAIRHFRIGYASGSDLARYFRYRGWNIEMARDLGLIGPYGEYFRERIVIPELRDGQAVYLVGRATIKRQRAKYIGLPGAPKPLYGRTSAQGAPDVFVVEGPFDWLTLVNWGYAARGLLGSHLKREHEHEFDSVERIHLVMDNDQEGRTARHVLSEKFGSRARDVRLPQGIKDVNELAQRPNGQAVFEQLVRQSELQGEEAT